MLVFTSTIFDSLVVIDFYAFSNDIQKFLKTVIGEIMPALNKI